MTKVSIIEANAYPLSRLLHWLCAISFVLLVISMPIMLDLASNSDERHNAYAFHMSTATVFIFLLLTRFIWMFLARHNGVCTVFDFKWQRYIARTCHFLLYFLMIFMPLTGIMTRITAGKDIEVFSWQLLPVIDSLIDRDSKNFANEAHLLLIDVFYVLIILHVVGALSHIATSFLSKSKSTQKK